jgi:hypothetical protein
LELMLPVKARAMRPSPDASRCVQACVPCGYFQTLDYEYVAVNPRSALAGGGPSTAELRPI